MIIGNELKEYTQFTLITSQLHHCNTFSVTTTRQQQLSPRPVSIPGIFQRDALFHARIRPIKAEPHERVRERVKEKEIKKKRDRHARRHLPTHRNRETAIRLRMQHNHQSKLKTVFFFFLLFFYKFLNNSLDDQFLILLNQHSTCS